jgi:hypothetical protein
MLPEKEENRYFDVEDASAERERVGQNWTGA